MNKGRILKCDPTSDGRIVAKLLLAIGGERPLGYYSLHFESLQEMSEAVMSFFINSEYFDSIVWFISKAQQASGDVPLPAPSEEWLRFLNQNLVRLGKYSRRLDLRPA